ncbi:MAG: phosphoenolpyruvate--protein phosphotransferase [Actinomycetota bacterium]
MKRLSGVAASPGTGVALAYVYTPDLFEIRSEGVADPDKAVAELADALAALAADLDEAAASTSGAAAEILRAQAAIARDPALRAAAAPAVRSGEQPARAVLAAGERFATELERTGNDYLTARAPDVRHICDLAARGLAGAPPRLPPRPIEPCVLVAEDLMPADTAGLDASLVLGIATESGSRTSHTSVVARGLGIPAVVGIRGLLDVVRNGGAIGIDGGAGFIVIDPDAATQRQLSSAGTELRARRERMRTAAGTGPAATADGQRIEVAANVRSVKELRSALAEGAEAVGLLRTELFYIDRDRPPSLDEQIALLREMHGMLGGRRLIVRTFDIGADKQVPFLPARPERNPELGVRGIRLAELHPELLDTQLRAVAATAALGPTAVMAPMVTTADEARWFRSRVVASGMPDVVEVGVMVEVPALALTAEELAGCVDFVSIGTNDLTQYLMAADRREADLGGFQDPFVPALLRAVAMVCRAGARRFWIGVCGEAAADPAWALLAVGLGVTELSMQADTIPAVRAALRGVTLDACRDAAMLALKATDPDQARGIARALLKESP